MEKHHGEGRYGFKSRPPHTHVSLEAAEATKPESQVGGTYLHHGLWVSLFLFPHSVAAASPCRGGQSEGQQPHLPSTEGSLHVGSLTCRWRPGDGRILSVHRE